MRTPARTTLIVAAVASLIATCAIGSPLALALVDRWWQFDWHRLADIGQAYGAASAVFSALAVAGVAVGLIYQGRQLRLARIQVTRDKHEQLLILAMGDIDTYGAMFGQRFAAMPSVQVRRHFFLVMAFNYFKLAYEGGTMNEHYLRTDGLGAYFESAEGRRHWEAISRNLDPHAPAVHRRFYAIVEDEYRKAVAAGPPMPEPVPQPPEAVVPARQPSTPAIVGASLAAAAVAGWLIGRRR
jgi:hypothetical protein